MLAFKRVNDLVHQEIRIKTPIVKLQIYSSNGKKLSETIPF